MRSSSCIRVRECTGTPAHPSQAPTKWIVGATMPPHSSSWTPTAHACVKIDPPGSEGLDCTKIVNGKPQKSYSSSSWTTCESRSDESCSSRCFHPSKGTVQLALRCANETPVETNELWISRRVIDVEAQCKCKSMWYAYRCEFGFLCECSEKPSAAGQLWVSSVSTACLVQVLE